MTSSKHKEQLETIFDYNLSPDERYILTLDMTKEEYQRVSNDCERIMGLACLFALRGDKNKSDYYANLLNNEQIQKQNICGLTVH